MQKKWLIGAGKMELTVGVLALQGGFREHIDHLNRIRGTNAVPVKKPVELQKCSGLIIPGGESTTMRKLIASYKFKEPIINFYQQQKVIWGTCAGLILMAKEVEGENEDQLGLLDIKIKRNAFGSQLESFVERSLIKKVSDIPQELVFIRAPIITEFNQKLEILHKKDKQITAVESDCLLGTAFHPELTDNLAFHKYFVNKIKNKR